MASRLRLRPELWTRLELWLRLEARLRLRLKLKVKLRLKNKSLISSGLAARKMLSGPDSRITASAALKLLCLQLRGWM
jgi:hypothetical protein